MPAFEAYVEANKRVSEAWGAYADVLKPDVPDSTLLEARQKIKIAQTERDNAGAQFNWSRENNELLALKGADKNLDEALATIAKAEAEILQALRDRVALEGRLELSEQLRREQLGKARELAYEIQRKKREAAAK